MKFHLCLLSILPTIMAKPFTMVPRSTDIERNKISEDLNIEEQYEAPGINVGHDMTESHHEPVSYLEKRNTAICSKICGVMDIQSCAKMVNTRGGVTTATENCAPVGILGFQDENDCEVTFMGHTDKPVCISEARVTQLAKAVFDQCVNNPAVGFGGCIDLEDTGHVCIRNANINDTTTCT
jgi:hypothetical protein